MLFSRRQALGVTAGGLFAFAARQQTDSLFGLEPTGTSKRCIVLWMEGGPSQMDTFDLNPGLETVATFNRSPRRVPRFESVSIYRCLPSIWTSSR